MKKFLAIAAAGGALAIGVPAAFAAADAPDTIQNTPVQEATPAPEQPQPREDCPEKDGGSAQGGSGYDAPATPNSGTEL